MTAQDTQSTVGRAPARGAMVAGRLLLLCLFAAPLQSALAFVAGDACVSPYVIADGDVDSLRAAIICANGDGVDSVIELAPGGEYLFTDINPTEGNRAMVEILNDVGLTIAGNGSTLKRDESSMEEFGLLLVGTDAVVVMSDLEITGGSTTFNEYGGGLRVRGSVHATGLRVIDNFSNDDGGGIAVTNGGSLILEDSVVDGNQTNFAGAGITVDATSSLWLLRSTVSNNETLGSGSGGGVGSRGVARISNSTIIGNVLAGATARGGGVVANNVTSDIVIVNSTIRDNYSAADGQQIRRSNGRFVIYNSIVSGTTADGIANCSNLTSLENTFVDDGTCSATASGSVGFLAASLASNGTEFLPLDGMQAAVLDTGDVDWLDESVLSVDLNGDGDTDDDLAAETDQAGRPRVVGAGLDLGAAELLCDAAGTYYPVNADELVAAIDCANADGIASTIDLVADRYAYTEAVMGTSNALPVIVDDAGLTLFGNQSVLERSVDATESFRLIEIGTDAETVIHDLAIEGGQLVGNDLDGGGIYNAGDLQLHGVRVANNSTDGLNSEGGGIANRGVVLISHSAIDGNQTLGAESNGGGLDHQGQGEGSSRTVTLVNTTVSRNAVADGIGGGAWVDTTALRMVNATLTGNTAGDGSELAIYNGQIRSYNVVISGTAGNACAGSGAFVTLAISDTIASDPSCGATYTADPLLDPQVSDGVFVPYYPLSGANLDTVNTGSNTWLDEATAGLDLNGDGDQNDDLSSGSDQTGEPRIACTTVDLGAVEYVDCDALYTIGGTVSGLADGNSVEVSMNYPESIVIAANGGFTLANPIFYKSEYAASVSAPPTTPNQTCTIANGSGTVGPANVTDIEITCVTDTYTVGGTLAGLASGTQLDIALNGTENLTLSANDPFAFISPLDDETSYEVVIVTQPVGPHQVCTVANGTGSLAGADITNVEITCELEQFSVGGTVSGLATGAQVELALNGMSIGALIENGSFASSPLLVDGDDYALTIATQPTAPNQVCTVTNGSGTINGADVTDIAIDCVTVQYSISGVVSGLAEGNEVTLAIAGPGATVALGNGSFTLPLAFDDGSSYELTVQQQPTTPNQVCTVTNGSGMIDGDDVTEVEVTCVTTRYRISGTITGLAGSGESGNYVGLALNGVQGPNRSNGSYTLPSLDDGSEYAVTVYQQPTTPSQTCVVANASGTLNGANVTNADVTCTTDQFTIGGTVTGLAAGNSVVLQNNAGDDLAVSANGVFTFATAIDDETGYDVSVLTQPTTPNQTCTVADGDGVLGGANVTGVAVTCVTVQYTVGGTLSGLEAGSIVLQNNGGDDLTLTADGAFEFPAALDDGSAFFVTISNQPEEQTCTVAGASGTLSGEDATSVVVSCADNAYPIGGTVTGLADDSGLVLTTGDEELTITTAGVFSFPTPLLDGSSYQVSIAAQPTTPNHFCVVTNGSGTVSGAAITDIAVSCIANGVDLAVELDGGSGAAEPGGLVTYMISVSNLGPVAAHQARVTTVLPGALTDVEWECMASGDADCPPSGTGSIDVLVHLPVGETVAFVLTAVLAEDFAGVLESAVTATADADQVDVDPANNEATDITSTDGVFADGFEDGAADVKAWLDNRLD